MRFYFNLREGGECVIDEEGRDLPDLEAAQAAAVQDARSVIAGEAAGGRLPLSAVIEVYDSAGTKVFEVPFEETVQIDG